MASNTGVLADVRVAFSDSSPVTWQKLENLSDMDVPSLTADDVDTGIYGLSYKRRIPGLKDVEDMVMTFLRDPSSVSAPNQNELFDLNASGAQKWWRVEIHASDDSTVDLWEAYEFEGRVGSFQPSAGFGDAARLVANVKFNGTSYTRYAPATSAIG